MIERIAIDSEMWERARGQVRDEVEHASFFLARLCDGALLCHAMRVVEAEGFARQSAVHIALTDHFGSELIRWAANDRSCLIELHSHVGPGRLCMSPTDVSGLEEWVPHVRWRLGGVPYAALVQSSTEIDGLIWSVGPQPHPLRVIDVSGRSIAASGVSFERWYRDG